MMRFEQTLKMMRAQEAKHQEQLQLIQNFVANLSGVAASGVIPKWMKFQVHFQIGDPSQSAVMAEGYILSATYDEAARLWIQHNCESNRRQPGLAEVFVCINDNLVVISPADAACIANSEGGKEFSPSQFTVDKRLIGDIEKTVWRKDEELPGWHASKPTEELLKEDEVPSPS